MRSLNLVLLTCVVLIAVGSWACFAEQRGKTKKKILFYSQSFGWRHPVVARPLTGELSHAEKVFKEFATKAGYEVSFSQDFHDLAGDQFKQYDAIVFYTSGNPLIHRENLLKWLRGGGALIGIHPATDTFRMDVDYPGGQTKGWPEYTKIIGAAFKTHGMQKPATIKVEVPDHPSTVMLDKEWTLLDEFYVFDENSFSRDNVRVLLSVDTEKTKPHLEAMKMSADGDHGIAWTNTEGKGRVFYTALGHREDVWTNPTYQQHVLGGIAWALGEAK